MGDSIQEFFSGIKVGARQTHKNMTLYCLLSATEAHEDFLTLDEALDSDALIISEVSEGGSVPELKVVNKSSRKVLLLDGEELVGAKQNRVLNVTVLVAPESETKIPVSCVEQGRWSYRGKHFWSASNAMSANLRKLKSQAVTTSLRHGDNFRADQGMVWEGIESQFGRLAAAPSPTMSMADLYERVADSSDEYLKAFYPVDQQLGMAVLIDGQIAGLEFLARFDAFKKTHSKLVNSYVLDALETKESVGEKASNASKPTVLNVLKAAAEARIEKRKSVALGNDLRLESDRLIGAGLAFDENLLQMSIFLKDRNQWRRKTELAIRRASQRKDSLKS
jgi:hypothetical protein